MKAQFNNVVGQRWVKRIIRWLLAVGIVFYAISGFGITEFRIIEPLTFGWLTKNLAFRIHTNPYIWLPFLVLLILHIYLSLKLKNRKLA